MYDCLISRTTIEWCKFFLQLASFVSDRSWLDMRAQLSYDVRRLYSNRPADLLAVFTAISAQLHIAACAPCQVLATVFELPKIAGVETAMTESRSPEDWGRGWGSWGDCPSPPARGLWRSRCQSRSWCVLKSSERMVTHYAVCIAWTVQTPTPWQFEHWLVTVNA